MIKYNFIEDIFSSIDTKQKAYWIGFLYADGYISSNAHTIGISLKESDKSHLLNFEKFLGISEDCLKYQEDTKSWRFYITRKKTYEDLVKIGFTSNKSYDNTTKVWDSIPEQYRKDFLLGLWDGDGSFFISEKHKQGASLISNNENLLSSLVIFINNSLGADFCQLKERTEGDPYPRIKIYYNKAKLFGDWLYLDVDYPILERKKKIYEQMKIGSRSHFGWDNPKTKGIICLESGNRYVTAKECALGEFGIDNPGLINSIRAVCRGDRKSTKNKHFRYMTEEEKQAEMENVNYG